MRVSLFVLLSASLLACSEPAPAAPSPAPKVETPSARTAEAPRELARPDVELRRAKVAAPDAGCVIELEQRIAPGARGVALSLAGTASVLVASDDALSLWQLGDSWREGPRLKLDAPLARANAVCGKDACELALIDQKMRLFHTRFDSAIQPLRELARGVDRRFSPAIAVQGERVLIAYTTTVDEVMHTKLLGVRADAVEPAQDVTPAGAGAAAPTFLLGSSTATLIALDAHAGISPLLEFPLDATGKPRAALVRTPVSQPYEPPQLAAVQWEDGEAEAFFTVVGKLAMTAIGRVPLRRTESIAALSPSRGYGELSFAVARGARRALFALEVPVASTPKAERSLELALSDGKRTDSGPSFPAPATAPSLARTQGGYLLAFTRAGEVHAALLRCSD